MSEVDNRKKNDGIATWITIIGYFIVIGLAIGLLVWLLRRNDSGQNIVDCVVNSQCPAEKPVCDTSKNICVECLSNAECTAPGQCINNICVCPVPIAPLVSIVPAMATYKVMFALTPGVKYDIYASQTPNFSIPGQVIDSKLNCETNPVFLAGPGSGTWYVKLIPKNACGSGSVSNEATITL